jgi:acetyl-CoA carboxylase carboxyltransferase component
MCVFPLAPPPSHVPLLVTALVGYKQPVFVYIPPGCELRGGAWAVIDPTINAEVMEMYADPTARGGVLEPSGTGEWRPHFALTRVSTATSPAQSVSAYTVCITSTIGSQFVGGGVGAVA